MRKAVFTVLVAVPFVLSRGTVTLASHVNCGDVIVADTTLDTDLTCAGSGLIIGADNVTVELNGHSLTSTSGTGSGIDNAGGYDHVTIKNGGIVGFGYGVFLMNTSYNVLDHLDVRNSVNSTGVEGTGILLWLGNDHARISHNTVADNDRQGVYLGCNPFAFTGVASDCDGKHATDSIIEHNTIERNGQAGFDSYGIQLHFADRNAVAHNRLNSHDTWGFGVGLYVLSSGDNQVEYNEADLNLFGIAVWNGGFAGSTDGNTFSNNSLKGNGDVGVRIWPGTAGTLVDSNHADGNGFSPIWYFFKDGINTPGAGVTLAKNHANDNADYGIQAAGAVDGGKNKARGNGNPAQCAGVSCK